MFASPLQINLKPDFQFAVQETDRLDRKLSGLIAHTDAAGKFRAL